MVQQEIKLIPTSSYLNPFIEVGFRSSISITQQIRILR